MPPNQNFDAGQEGYELLSGSRTMTLDLNEQLVATLDIDALTDTDRARAVGWVQRQTFLFGIAERPAGRVQPDAAERLRRPVRRWRAAGRRPGTVLTHHAVLIETVGPVRLGVFCHMEGLVPTWSRPLSFGGRHIRPPTRTVLVEYTPPSIAAKIAAENVEHTKNGSAWSGRVPTMYERDKFAAALVRGGVVHYSKNQIRDLMLAGVTHLFETSASTRSTRT